MAAFIALAADAEEAAVAANRLREGPLLRVHRNAFALSDERFRRLFRLSKDTVRWLCDQLRDEEGLRRRRVAATTVTVEQQVLCALRFFGAGSFQGTVATDEYLAVSQPSVSVAVRKVAAAIVRRLGDEGGWISFPGDEAAKASVKAGFLRRGGLALDGVLGCIDGTLIAIKGPEERHGIDKAAYWCRKQHYALNVMVVCDAKNRILAIRAGNPGSDHDATVWRSSGLRASIMNGDLMNDGEFLLGDSGYPLEPWLLTPVPGHNHSAAERRYNMVHSSMRSVVERCFGVLKHRFRCLQKHRTLQYQPNVATSIIEACAVLHNICLHFSEPQPEGEYEDEVDLNEPGPSQASGGSATGSSFNRGRLARQAQINRLERIRRHR